MLNTTSDTLFDGPGEMRALYRAHNWSSTSLGPVESWPNALRSVVRTMMASRHPMFLWWGPDLVQIYNDAYRPSFGGDGRHLKAIGANGREFWTEIWDAIGPQIMQVMSGGESTWHEDQYLPIWRNGRLEDVYWTYSYSAAHDDHGDIGGVLVVCQETTSQVHLRQQLELERSRLAYTFQQSPSFVAILRGPPPFEFEFVNEAYISLVGERDLIGRRVFDALPDVRNQGFEELLARVYETGEPFVGTEIPFMVSRSPGAPSEERFIDLVYFPVKDVDGKSSGLIAHGVDVTEQVHARREVERLLLESERQRTQADTARREADNANKAKGDFLAMLSHELRTPLAAISGYADLLSMGLHGALSEGQAQYLSRIQHSQRHLLGLIDGLLIYSQAEAGKVQFHLENIPVRELLTSSEALTSPQANARDLRLSIVECVTPGSAYGDREKIQQIIVNLLGNSIKFTEPGGNIVARCECDAHAVRISVKDSGIGIPTQDLKRIFDPFVQLGDKASRGKGGTGLGLAISQTLARGMGGDLTVESTVGVGSVFTLTLPCGVES